MCLLLPAAAGTLHGQSQAGWRFWLASDGMPESILLNLVGNAIKFTERGEIGVEVALKASNVETRRKRVSLHGPVWPSTGCC